MDEEPVDEERGAVEVERSEGKFGEVGVLKETR